MKEADDFLRTVAQKLCQSLYVSTYREDRRVFLCGANPGTGKGVRNRLGECLQDPEKGVPVKRYVVHYPEELFDGLMAGPNRYDLLTLENMLADAVDAVVLVVESPGAIAELGAFANHQKLRKKLVVIQDERYRHAKSFIGHGPIRLLQDKKAGVILFLPLERIEEHIIKIKAAVEKVTNEDPVPFKLSNIFHVRSLIVPSLFLLESLTRDEIAVIVAEGSGSEDIEVQAVVSTAISLLLAERVIAREQNTFRLTEAGVMGFISRGRWFDAAIYNTDLMDRIRIDVLTRQRRKLRPWPDGR